jgi:hypothetical protein
VNFCLNKAVLARGNTASAASCSNANRTVLRETPNRRAQLLHGGMSIL